MTQKTEQSNGSSAKREDMVLSQMKRNDFLHFSRKSDRRFRN